MEQPAFDFDAEPKQLWQMSRSEFNASHIAAYEWYAAVSERLYAETGAEYHRTDAERYRRDIERIRTGQHFPSLDDHRIQQLERAQKRGDALHPDALEELREYRRAFRRSKSKPDKTPASPP